jgi:nucleoside-diphosphate-sugar epimerase
MQTILGAGGAIGVELAKALRDYTHEIRLVSRNPQKVNDSDELFTADLRHRNEVFDAVEGTDIVYLTVGLPYKTSVWQSTWPVIMENVLDACQEYNAKLVFFDNVYMYDPDNLNPMTEETPINPTSEKGKTRAKLVRMINKRVDKGEIDALIARSADFYGPSIQDTSILTESVFDKLAQGKKAEWLSSVDYKHSFTYTPDAGRATALLGNTPKAYGEVWHLPTASNPPTGKQWIEMIADELGVEPKYRTAPKFVIRIMGWFDDLMSELVEMIYQYDRDYVFDSSKFEQHFDFSATPYKEGIKQIVEADYR